MMFLDLNVKMDDCQSVQINHVNLQFHALNIPAKM